MYRDPLTSPIAKDVAIIMTCCDRPDIYIYIYIYIFGDYHVGVWGDCNIG